MSVCWSNAQTWGWFEPKIWVRLSITRQSQEQQPRIEVGRSRQKRERDMGGLEVEGYKLVRYRVCIALSWNGRSIQVMDVRVKPRMKEIISTVLCKEWLSPACREKHDFVRKRTWIEYPMWRRELNANNCGFAREWEEFVARERGVRTGEWGEEARSSDHKNRSVE